MTIGEILAKSNPLQPQKETSQSEYKKMVDTNTKLVDKIKYQEEEINRLKANEEFFCKCITKALHKIQLLQMDGEVEIKDLTELVNVLKYGGIDKE